MTRSEMPMGEVKKRIINVISDYVSVPVFAEQVGTQYYRNIATSIRSGTLKGEKHGNKWVVPLEELHRRQKKENLPLTDARDVWKDETVNLVKLKNYYNIKEISDMYDTKAANISYLLRAEKIPYAYLAKLDKTTVLINKKFVDENQELFTGRK